MRAARESMEIRCLVVRGFFYNHFADVLKKLLEADKA